MSWVEKNQKVNNWGWGWTIIRDSQAKTNAPVSQTSSEDLKLITQTYQMRNKELKMKLDQLQEEISKASLPVM